MLNLSISRLRLLVPLILTRVDAPNNKILFFISRDEPPTNEELGYNLSIMEMKKSNAKKIDDKFGTNKDDQIVTGMAFPTYEEYERVPGKKPGEK